VFASDYHEVEIDALRSYPGRDFPDITKTIFLVRIFDRFFGRLPRDETGRKRLPAGDPDVQVQP